MLRPGFFGLTRLCGGLFVRLPHRDQALHPGGVNAHLLRDLLRGHTRTPHLLDLFFETDLSFTIQNLHLLDAFYRIQYTGSYRLLVSVGGELVLSGAPHQGPESPKVPTCATICYMKDERERVGVRELRQNLSVYLRRVASGETLEVTERNRAVAILAPLPEASTPLGRLISTGRATAPVGDLLDLDPPEGEVSTRLSDALEREREERLP